MPEDVEEEPPPPKGKSLKDWSKENRFMVKRLEYMRGLMSRLLWNPKEHREILAKKWHITNYQVDQVAVEASRQLELLQGKNDPRARETVNTLLLEVAQEAREAGEYIAAVSALKAVGEFTVEPRAQKIDVAYEVRNMSDNELLEAYKRELAAANEIFAKPEAKQIARGVAIQEAEFEEDKETAKVLKERDGD